MFLTVSIDLAAAVPLKLCHMEVSIRHLSSLTHHLGCTFFEIKMNKIPDARIAHAFHRNIWHRSRDSGPALGRSAAMFVMLLLLKLVAEFSL